MATSHTCARCGTDLSGPAPEGLCPRCMLGSALEYEDDPTCSVHRTSGDSGSTAPASYPRRFGDYELLEEIGRGGMGVVFRARQVSLNRIVALKMLLHGDLINAAFIRRFRTEAEAAAQLDHPNIVPIFEVGEQRGEQFFSMKLIEGTSLAAVADARENAVLSPGELSRKAATVMAKVARAVHYAHQHGILHRDIKPQNILVDRKGEPHLTDFGLAKLLQTDPGLTLSDAVLGSPNFMAPEQAAGQNRHLTTAADVFSLGAVLYTLLTGRPPFQAETPWETMRRVLEEDPVLPSRLCRRRPEQASSVQSETASCNSQLDPEIETICLKCLEKDPKRRYGSAEALAEDLERWLRYEPVAARPPSTVIRLRKWMRRKPAVAGLVIALCGALVFGLTGIVWQGQRARRQWLASEQNLYIENIHRGLEALAGHNLGRVRERLQLIAESAPQRAMRGWEWSYLMGHSQGNALATLEYRQPWIADLQTVPGRPQVGIMSENGTVEFLDTQTRQWAARWSAHADLVRERPLWQHHALAFSPEGSTLFTAGEDRALRAWEVNSGRMLWQTNFSNTQARLAVSPDGRLLAAASPWGEFRLLDLSTRPPKTMRHWTSAVEVLVALEFAPDGATLFAGGVGLTVRVFAVPSPESDERHLAGSSGPLTVSPDGQWLATSTADRRGIQLWTLPGLALQAIRQTRGGSLASLRFSPDSQTLAAGFADGKILLWRSPGPPEPAALLGHEENAFLAFSADGRSLVSASTDKTACLWDPSAACEDPSSFPHGERVQAVAFSPDSRYLASVAREAATQASKDLRGDYTLKLWELSPRGLKWVASVTNSPGGLTPHVTFWPDGRMAAVDDWATLRAYEVPLLRKAALDRRGRLPVFAPGGQWFAYASDKSVWRQEGTASPPVVLCSASSPVSALALAPDGGLLATGCWNGQVGLWNARNGQALGALQGHEGNVVCLTFSPSDGRTLVSAGWDGRLGIWDVPTRRLKTWLRGHSGFVNWAAFSADGRTLATSGEDDVVRLWNVARWQEIGVLHSSGASVNSVAFSPDGQWLASGSDNGTIQLWCAPRIEESAARLRNRR